MARESDERPDPIATLRLTMPLRTQGEWRVGYQEKWHVFVPHPEGTLVPAHISERVLLRFNEHFPYDYNAAHLVAAVNAAPLLLAELDRLRDHIAHQRRELARLRAELETRRCYACALKEQEARHG